jgi:hypothetical protein
LQIADFKGGGQKVIRKSGNQAAGYQGIRKTGDGIRQGNVECPITNFECKNRREGTEQRMQNIEYRRQK